MYSITLLGIIIAVFSITALMGEINAWVSGELAVVLKLVNLLLVSNNLPVAVLLLLKLIGNAIDTVMEFPTYG